MVEKGEKVAEDLEKARKDLAKASKAAAMLNRYKFLKKNADLSNAANVDGMQELLKEACDLSKKELIEWKTTMSAAASALSSIQDIGKVIDIKKYCDVGSRAIDKIESEIDTLHRKFSATLDRVPSMLNNNLENIIKQLLEEDEKIAEKIAVDTVIADLKMRKIIGEFGELQQSVTDLFNITASGVDAKTGSNEGTCCVYSKVFCSLLASVAGIKSPKESGEKNYVERFGRGYIAKGLYTAIANAYKKAIAGNAKAH